MARVLGFALLALALGLAGCSQPPPQIADTTGQPKPGDVQIVDLGGGVTLELVWVPPGTFIMGSPPSEALRGENEVQHSVTLTQGFWMGKYEVTQAQWEQVMGDNPSHFKATPMLPVEQVSWDNCQEFLKKLNSRVGEGGFGLPTEAQWEYACRAGTTTPFCFGETVSTDKVNYDGNYVYRNGRKGAFRETTTPVGSFPANTWGLHDMHGNVWEWCEDRRGEYPSGSVIDTHGPSTGECRILRGGSWINFPRGCRSASRAGLPTSYRGYTIGFRVVRVRSP